MQSYATRNDAFSPATIWVLDGAVLRIEPDKGAPRAIPLGQVRSLRLDYAPTRPERNRYRCQLMLPSGQTLTCFNRTCAGIYDFRDTSADYVGFVSALAAALAQHAPGCRFVTGATHASYAFNLAATAFVLLLLGSVAWFLLVSGLVWLLAIKALFLLFYLPTLFRWVARNRPRSFDPAAIPTGVLPTVSARPPALPVPRGD